MQDLKNWSSGKPVMESVKKSSFPDASMNAQAGSEALHLLKKKN